MQEGKAEDKTNGKISKPQREVLRIPQNELSDLKS